MLAFSVLSKRSVALSAAPVKRLRCLLGVPHSLGGNGGRVSVASAAVHGRDAMTATPMTRTPTLVPGSPPRLDGRASEDNGAGTLMVANAALRGGFVLLPRTLLHAPGLSRDAKLLYAVLLSYAWQRGSCFPGYARLQADLGCGINQVTQYLRELEDAQLVTRRRRGLGKTTIYTLHDPPAPPKAEPDTPPETAPVRTLIHQIGELGVTGPVKAASPVRRHKQDSGEQDPEEHQPSADSRPPQPMPTKPPSTLAPTSSPPHEPASAVDDDALLELLIAHGVTRRIAQDLAATHSGDTIRQQVEWQRYRPAAKSPAGALVQAIRDGWPAPLAWVEAQEHEAAVARQREEEARRVTEDEVRRREWEQRPPEERIAGKLQFWEAGRRHKGATPTEAEVAAKRTELLAQVRSEPA
jgi:Helix-turn-helix domain